MAKLLAPGGTREMALAVLDEGAETVYVGPVGWSRRASQFELTDEDIRAVVDAALARRSDVRVAMNTSPGSSEVPALLRKLEQYVTWGISGIIMSDIGCIAHVHREFPQLAIHTSVACGVTNSLDIAFYRDLGASMIILPYKLSTEEVRRIKEKIAVGLEVFLFQPIEEGVHCPGRCSMSSYFRMERIVDSAGKEQVVGSVNRGGSCYRVCQAEWTLHVDGVAQKERLPVKTDGTLMFWELPQYLRLGVDYLKIQGRERPVPLVRDIVAFYRRLVNELDRGDPDEVIEGYLPEWEALKTRWETARSRHLRGKITQASGGRAGPS